MFHFIGVMIRSIVDFCTNINGLIYRVYLQTMRKFFSFHYFYLRNKILTLKILNFFNNSIISVINFKTLFLLYNRRLDKIFLISDTINFNICFSLKNSPLHRILILSKYWYCNWLFKVIIFLLHI